MKSLFAVLLPLMLTIPASAAKETSAPVVERPWLLEDEKNTINVFEKAANSVVFVNNSKLVGNLFSHRVYEVPAGAGSGFIWDSQGYIITNFHVIQNARNVSVTLKDGQKYNAKIVGAEPRKDIAVLKIENAKDLPPGFSTILADSSEIVVGQKTIAIGNPFELSHTLTTGIVSALNRSLPSPAGFSIRDMIQTDAAINPGNSGGPLMDSRGYLIGMNTAIFSQSGSSAGVGFAVPSNTIKRIANQIIKSGRVTQPGIGVALLDEKYSRMAGVKGPIIYSVRAGGAAQKAGLKGTKAELKSEKDLGDVILSIDGKPVTNADDVYNVLESKQVGDSVPIEYQRMGIKKSTKVQLEKAEYE